MAKIMQTGAMKVYFQIAECSLSYAKIQIKSEKPTPFGGIFSGHGPITFCFLVLFVVDFFLKTG